MSRSLRPDLLTGGCLINAAIGTLAWASGAVSSLVRTGVGIYELTVDQIDLLEYVIKTQTVVASINACAINVELVSPVLLRVRTSSSNVAFDIDFLLMIERAQTKRDANVFVPSPVPPPPAAGGGNVVGPAGATDNAIARFDGATGLLIQDSLVLISDLGNIGTPAGAILLPSHSFSADPDTGFFSPGANQVALSLGGVLAVQWTGGQTLAGSLGAAGTPAYSFTGDPNTGLFSSAADTLDWSTGGVSRLTLTTTTLTSTVVALGPAGAIGAPTWSFSGDTNSGLYSSGADQVSLSLGGAEAYRWTTTQMLAVGLGAAGTPAYSFTGDPNTGVFSSGADVLDLSAGGTSRLSISTSAITPSVPFRATAGATGAPSYSFTGDSNTGAWSPGADIYAISVGGTERFRTGGTGIRFFTGAEAAQQTIGALTNNVTAGGVDGTIANFTDLTIYANDSAAIRNDIYQLARTVNQITTALRAYGLGA